MFIEVRQGSQKALADFVLRGIKVRLRPSKVGSSTLTVE
jgi:hypothetical protein